MSQLYNDMLTTSDITFQNLLQTYSICPPSDPGFAADVPISNKDVHGVRTDRAKINTGSGSRDPRLSGSSTNSIETRKVSKANAQVYIDLNPYPLQTLPGAMRGHEGGNTLYFNVSQALQVNWAPIWFLPWRPGCAVRLTIPPVGLVATPNIFFTAAINGCSVFIQGTAQNPTITHCGGSTGLSEWKTNLAVDFWEAVMEELQAADTLAAKNVGAMHGTSVNKEQYVSQRGYTSMDNSGLVSKSTKHALRFKTNLKGQVRNGRVRIEDVSPWGCVLGRRDAAGDWSFFLQENATITYHEVTKHTFSRNVNSATARVSVPMRYREFFPNGQKHATIVAPLPRIV
jgi:hypothetical protein